jgi:hypothetical protein
VNKNFAEYAWACRSELLYVCINGYMESERERERDRERDRDIGFSPLGGTSFDKVLLNST